MMIDLLEKFAMIRAEHGVQSARMFIRNELQSDNNIHIVETINDMFEECTSNDGRIINKKGNTVIIREY